jgi:hypothetical protein
MALPPFPLRILSIVHIDVETMTVLKDVQRHYGSGHPVA